MTKKGGSLRVKNNSKYLANLCELIPINSCINQGTLNPPMCGKHFAHTPSYWSKNHDQKGGSLRVKNRSKYVANLWELIPINSSMIQGTLNPPMCVKHSVQTTSDRSNHLDQKGGSLKVKNSSKYLANPWELIPINPCMIQGTLNPPMCGKHSAQTPSNRSKNLDQKGGSLTVKNSSKCLANLWKLIPVNSCLMQGTLNPPMCGKHFAHTPSYYSNHLDQKGGSLTVKNSSNYLANL